ncbi:MAG: hypothetical protein V2A66_05720 [Pseudomonadota bacterium]
MKITYLTIFLGLVMVVAVAGCGSLPSSGSVTWGTDGQSGGTTDGTDEVDCTASTADENTPLASNNGNGNGNNGNGNGNGGSTDTGGTSTGGDNTGDSTGTTAGSGTSKCRTTQSGGDTGSSSGGGQNTTNSGDTTGGMQFLTPAQPQETPRYFMGTYELVASGYYSGARCEQGFPGTIRLYSHDEVIDFETTKHELFTIANMYEDKTFDFDVTFLDRFGKPSIDIICTCHLNVSYYSYIKERVLCTCDPSNDKDSCGVTYDKLDSDE